MPKKIYKSRTNLSAVGSLAAGIAVNVIAARVPLLAPFKDELTLLVLTIGTAAVSRWHTATRHWAGMRRCDPVSGIAGRLNAAVAWICLKPECKAPPIYFSGTSTP